MVVDTYVPYTSNEGIDYLIRFTVFTEGAVPEGIKIPIVDIVIETDASVEIINNSASSLFQISKIILEYATKHDAIYYCYCSEKPIKKSKKRLHLKHQHYSSLLFCKMFDKCSDLNFFNKTIIIDDPTGDHYIHLMARLENENFVNFISEKLSTLDK